MDQELINLYFNIFITHFIAFIAGMIYEHIANKYFNYSTGKQNGN